MKKISLILLTLLLCNINLMAQISLTGFQQANINPALLHNRWNARWISVPGEPQNTYGIYHMRKTFELENVPEHFIVHVTADNRYKLYVNAYGIMPK